MGNKKIIDNLMSDGAIFRCQGLIAAVKEKANTPEVIKAMSALKNDEIEILGRKVSSYAFAALDVLGAEKYSGTDPEVFDLIPFFIQEAATA